MTIAPDVLERHGLKPDEYQRIVDALKREPTLTELGIFSVMWSEHCSYKSSRVHLRTLPTTGPRVLQGPGENAGAVDIGDGLAAVFKIESHNHPSFIEPYQGAATGVGGIIRDIFTMGARPIALLNSLRFGSLDDPLVRRTFAGVVAGIAGYGNSIGIPTVGGEVGFDESYTGNPLVNVFCLGIANAADIIKGVASGAGNAVYYVGAKTGRDGIHGATMASAEFDDKSAEKRPAVQVGDPFMEKLLLEACLEVMKTDALIGIQDMGAAGLTCSTSEMGSRGGAGVEIDVSLVPQRESGMTPYEIMLSESQERMLMVVKRGREAEVEQIFEKWDLHAVRVGEVTTDGKLRVKNRGEVVAEIPNRALTDEAPRVPAADVGAGLHQGSAAALLGVARQAGRAGGSLQALACVTDDREQAVGVPPVRPHGAHQYARHAWYGRGRRARQGHESRAGDVGRLQRPLCLPRSVCRRPVSGCRSGAERRVRRRCSRSAPPTASTSAIPSAPRSCGSSPSAVEGMGAACRALGHSDHRGQRQPLQRNRRPRGAPDTGAWRGRTDRRGGYGRPPCIPGRRRCRHHVGRYARRAWWERIPESDARPDSRRAACARPRARGSAAPRARSKAQPRGSFAPHRTVRREASR